MAKGKNKTTSNKSVKLMNTPVELAGASSNNASSQEKEVQVSHGSVLK